jgi:hypothetical protein
MSSKTKIEYVMAELISEDGQRKYTPKLKLTVELMYVNEKAEPVARAVAENELTPMSGMVEFTSCDTCSMASNRKVG